jgi:hypothetical protein
MRALARFSSGSAVVLALVLAPGQALAQGNYRSAPMGGRTTLLGGTGVVYGLDGAAVFTNPATALRTDPGRLSFSVNFYSLSFMQSPSWYRPGAVDPMFGPLDIASTSASDTRLASLPSSLCLFFRVGRIPWFRTAAKEEPRIRDARLGLCFATTQTESFYFNDEGVSQRSRSGIVTRHSEAVTQTFRRFQLGPTYSMWIVPGLTVGASLHGSIASHSSSLTALARSEGGPLANPINSMFQSVSNGSSWQLHAIAGATYSFGRQSVGIAIESPSLHLFGTGGATFFTESDAIQRESLAQTGRGSFSVQTPTRLSLGTGFERSWGTLEIDVSMYAPIAKAYSASINGHRVTETGEESVSTPEKLDLSQRARGVVNVGIGAEIFSSRSLSFLGGLSTDLSAVPSGSLKGTLFNYYPARTNRIAGSFGVGSHRSDGSLIVGTELSFGWGERLTVNSYQAPPEVAAAGHRTMGILFVIAGSTSFRAISRAVEDVTKAVKGDDKKAPTSPTPARTPDVQLPTK